MANSQSQKTLQLAPQNADLVERLHRFLCNESTWGTKPMGRAEYERRRSRREITEGWRHDLPSFRSRPSSHQPIPRSEQRMAVPHALVITQNNYASRRSARSPWIWSFSRIVVYLSAGDSLRLGFSGPLDIGEGSL